MAASDELELKAAIMRGIERQFEGLMDRMGIVAPSVLPDPGLGGSAFGQDVAQNFATGYDGTNTTMPFVLDLSILTDGSSGDLLTG